MTRAAVRATAGDERHGGGARSDDGNLLVGVVEVARPELRVHDAAAEGGEAGDRGLQRRVVVVVARAEHEEPAAEVLDRGAPVGGGDLNARGPRLLARPPARVHDAVPVADVRVDALGRGALLEVLDNQAALGDGVVKRPGPPREAKCVQVRVGAHAGVAHQVPGAAHGLAPLEDDVRLAAQHGLSAVRHVDTGDAGADDEHVDVFRQLVLGQGLEVAGRVGGELLAQAGLVGMVGQREVRGEVEDVGAVVVAAGGAGRDGLDVGDEAGLGEGDRVDGRGGGLGEGCGGGHIGGLAVLALFCAGSWLLWVLGVG